MGGTRALPVLVAGGGLAGLRAALDVAAAGRDVLLVEAGRQLGGGVAHLQALFPTGEDPRGLLAPLVEAALGHERIAISLETTVTAISGAPGHFRVGLQQRGGAGETTVSAASVIAATGCVPFDPDRLDTLGHASIPDVVTSVAFEGLLAAPGPLARPSDGASPQRIAFVLCVGSRLHYPLDRGYCSGICCATAIRQALAAKAADRTVFAMDVRAHVPGTQNALEQAKEQGVQFRYARPHTLTPGPEGRGVALRYVDEAGCPHEETVDMAVLAVGLEVSGATRILAQTAGIALTRHGFVRSDCFEPATTSRAGIFVAGNLAGPGEAALATVQGSAAGLGALAASARPEKLVDKGIGPALVVGGGAAGLTSALAMAQNGLLVTLLEHADHLGGNPRRHPIVWKGRETGPALAALAHVVAGHPGITVHLSTRLVAVAGEPGRFRGMVETPDGPATVDFGAAVLTLGGVETSTEEYLHERDPRVFTQLAFEDWRRQRPKEAEAARTVVFLQCVGSRGPDYPACARVCCVQALSAAVEMKKQCMDTLIAVFYQDIAAYGENEDLYTEARRLGVLFFRYSPEAPPQVERIGTTLTVTGTDRLLGRIVRLEPDALVLALPLVASRTAGIAELFGCRTDALGFIAPVHPVLFPVDTSQSGIFAAGLCLGPKPLDETMTEARAAAMRAVAFLAG
jgi:heterodisulfide reductase subunit A